MGLYHDLTIHSFTQLLGVVNKKKSYFNSNQRKFYCSQKIYAKHTTGRPYYFLYKSLNN